jgi:hypothetical protein
MPGGERTGSGEAAPPVLVLTLHAHLVPAVWAATRRRPGLRLGYVQTVAGALPRGVSSDVARLRESGLLAGHLTAGAPFRQEREAIREALDTAAGRLGWEAIVCGPGAGTDGSVSVSEPGGTAALENAQAALALGLPTLLSPRLSGSDPRPEHRGLSDDTSSVLECLRGSVRVPVPEIELEGWPTGDQGPGEVDLPSVLDALHTVCDDHHDVSVEAVDLEAYAASDLPARTDAPTVEEDSLFFAAPLAAGAALAKAARMEG